ncbi:MAG: aminopeptidase P family protein [Geodermatophilaceae bacterium]|nr:aminopeptidase P family protein [Geodermatophilaceae bacterium]
MASDLASVPTSDPTAHPASDNSAVRRDRLRGQLADLGVDAALITGLVSVRYLTGFTGSNAALVVYAGSADVFCTDGRYRTQSAAQVPDLERVIERNCARAMAERLDTEKVARIGYESHTVTVDGLDELRATAPAADLSSLQQAVEGLRAVKDEDEVAQLREACAIADRALADLIERGGIRLGRTELEVGRDLDALMLELGAQERSFETIVATGPNSAVPHHRPTTRILERGDFVKFDFGARYGGYHSDMTRTFVLGEPADWQREVYAVVHDAQRLGREALRIGADVRDVDAAARDHVKAAGYGDEFSHGLGHGVGLEIHEAPTVSYLGAGTLAERMTVTVEPGVYLEGRGGVRIEDTLVVRADGPELLTQTSKDLTVL